MAKKSTRKRYPDDFPLSVEGLALRGHGFGWHGERRVEVRAAPPGAVVETRVVKRRKGVLLGRRLRLMEPPPGAVEPRCPYFLTCGGCALQELSLESQRGHRHALALGHVGSTEGVQVHPPRGTAQAYGYRNKVELTFGTARYLSEQEMADGVSRGGRFLGFHAPERFNRIVDVSRCELISEELNQVLEGARAHMAVSTLEPWDTSSHEGFWRHLLLRETTTGHRLAAIFTAPPSTGREEAELSALADALPGVSGVAWYVNPRVGDAAQGDLQACLRGHLHLDERLGELDLRLSPTSFFQTSTGGAEVLYRVVAEAAGEGGTLLDLYCGTGTIALSLAKGFQRVLGVEVNPAAVRDAEENAALNGVGHVEFVAGTVEGQDGLPPADVVVVDPPRAGLHPSVARALASAPAERLVYVACHPPSLGRDREALEAGGWRLRQLWTVDMFPQTGHVETVGLFTRADGAAG